MVERIEQKKPNRRRVVDRKRWEKNSSQILTEYQFVLSFTERPYTIFKMASPLKRKSVSLIHFKPTRETAVDGQH